VALTPDGKTLLTVNAGSNTVSFIDTVSRYEQARIPCPTARGRSCSTRREKGVCLQHPGEQRLRDRRAEPGVAATITTESARCGAAQPQGDRLYVIHQWSRTCW